MLATAPAMAEKSRHVLALPVDPAMHQALYTLLLLCILTTLSACGGGTRAAAPEMGSRWQQSGSAAARYCAEAGGRLEIRQGSTFAPIQIRALTGRHP